MRKICSSLQDFIQYGEIYWDLNYDGIITIDTFQKSFESHPYDWEISKLTTSADCYTSQTGQPEVHRTSKADHVFDAFCRFRSSAYLVLVDLQLYTATLMPRIYTFPILIIDIYRPNHSRFLNHESQHPTSGYLIHDQLWWTWRIREPAPPLTSGSCKESLSILDLVVSSDHQHRWSRLTWLGQQFDRAKKYNVLDYLLLEYVRITNTLPLVSRRWSATKQCTLHQRVYDYQSWKSLHHST